MLIRDKKNRLLRIDKYKVLDQLGKGGFGTVYHVQDIRDGQEYALKLFHNAYNTKRIKAELEVLKLLNTSALFLKTYLSKNIFNRLFLLCEYAADLNLENLVKKEAFSELNAVNMLLQLLDSLEFLHKHNLIHGDVKAENIMKKGERFFLIDYDTVKITNRVKTLHILNDDDFTAPEIYQGIELLASDIYALGCTLYYVLTGKSIYGFSSEDDFSKKMFAHLYNNPQFNKKISHKIFYLINRMTDKNPKTRATIKEIRLIIQSNFSMDKFIYTDEKKDNFTSEYERYEYMAENGVVYAQNVVGLIHEEGIETKKDLKKAFYWYNLASEQGLAKANFNLALCYKMAKGCSVDYVKALELFQRAAEQGHGRSYYHLGDMYEKGLGVDSNMKRAKYFYNQSALHGYKPAYNKITRVNTLS